MAEKINGKNKIFIVAFAIIVVAILAILVTSVTLTRANQTVVVYDISNTSVLFNSSTNLVDTTSGGKIEKHWDDKYYYVSNESDITNELGTNPVVYEKADDSISVFGTIYEIYSNGNVTKNNAKTTIDAMGEPAFYKLSDRVYLVVADEIKNQISSIYANRYLIVYIDKQGNASVLNDALNVKTINPMTLSFGEYSFDIANEKLVIGETIIDLKLVNGSTNEYVEKTVDEQQQQGLNDLINAYNMLVADFSQYVENNTLNAGASNQVGGSTIVVDGGGGGTASGGGTAGGGTSGGGSSGNVSVAANSTNLEKRISLRGAVSYPTYIDVNYIVTDPENKYQVVYLLVTGDIGGTYQTQKILIDKYVTGYRINGLTPKSEYSISLGRVAVETDEDTGDRSLVDDIEDVINVRTTPNNMSITIEKIANGYVYFNFKMSTAFAASSGVIALYADDERVGEVGIQYAQAISEKGFSDRILLTLEADVYTLKLENAVYGDAPMDIKVVKKFTVGS